MSDLKDIRDIPLTININGAEMQVEYDFNALAYLEEQTKLGRYDFYKKLCRKELSIKQELILIHAGLIRHNDKITLKQVGQITSFEGIIKNIIQAYNKIFLQPEIYNQIYFPEKEDSEEKKI